MNKLQFTLRNEFCTDQRGRKRDSAPPRFGLAVGADSSAIFLLALEKGNRG
jgi:hypothetical protein